MMLVHVLAGVAMLPVLVVSERFSFGGCGTNFDNTITPIAHTEQGVQTLQEFAAIGAGRAYLWQPFNKERDQGITSLQFSTTTRLATFTLTYKKTGSVTPITTTGSLTYQFQPKQVILLNTPANAVLDGIFSFNNRGEADLYPLLITKTDLILRGCVEAFMGRLESLYVLTNQNYSMLDSVCSRQAIKDNFDNWDVVVAPQ